MNVLRLSLLLLSFLGGHRSPATLPTPPPPIPAQSKNALLANANQEPIGTQFYALAVHTICSAIMGSGLSVTCAGALGLENNRPNAMFLFFLGLITSFSALELDSFLLNRHFWVGTGKRTAHIPTVVWFQWALVRLFTICISALPLLVTAQVLTLECRPEEGANAPPLWEREQISQLWLLSSFGYGFFAIWLDCLLRQELQVELKKYQKRQRVLSKKAKVLQQGILRKDFQVGCKLR